MTLASFSSVPVWQDSLRDISEVKTIEVIKSTQANEGVTEEGQIVCTCFSILVFKLMDVQLLCFN